MLNHLKMLLLLPALLAVTACSDLPSPTTVAGYIKEVKDALAASETGTAAQTGTTSSLVNGTAPAGRQQRGAQPTTGTEQAGDDGTELQANAPGQPTGGMDQPMGGIDQPMGGMSQPTGGPGGRMASGNQRMGGR